MPYLTPDPNPLTTGERIRGLLAILGVIISMCIGCSPQAAADTRIGAAAALATMLFLSTALMICFKNVDKMS